MDPSRYSEIDQLVDIAYFLPLYAVLLFPQNVLGLNITMNNAMESQLHESVRHLHHKLPCLIARTESICELCEIPAIDKFTQDYVLVRTDLVICIVLDEVPVGRGKLHHFDFPIDVFHNYPPGSVRIGHTNLNNPVITLFKATGWRLPLTR